MADCWRIAMDRWRSKVSAFLLILEVFSTTVDRNHFVQAQTSNLPLNAAANVGDKVVFNCTTGSSTIPRWSYKETGIGQYTPISYIGTCNSVIPTRFVVESTGNGNCNLIIPSATTAEAIIYQCDDGAAFVHSMLLTIIESVEVSPNSAAEEPCSGDPLNITCSVKYSAVSTPGFKMFPSIMWTNLSANVNISGTNLTSPNVTTSYLSIVTSPPTVSPYSCNVYFNTPTLPPGLATNTPNYYKSTDTAQLQVEYLSGNANITSNITESCVNDTALLKCKVDGYPEPSYEWRNADINAIISNTNEVIINSGGHYECIAHSSACNSTTRKFPCENATTCATCSGVDRVVISYDGTEVDEKLQCPDCSSVLLTCNASGLPEPMYEWTTDDTKKQDGKDLTVSQNGNVTCEAYNFIKGVRYSDSRTVLVTGIVVPVSDEDTIIIIVVVSVCGWIVINLIFSGISFAIYRKHRVIMNAKFPWLKKMMPFANSKDENVIHPNWKKVLCISLCVVTSVFVAVFVYPILFAIAGCPCCQKSHQGSKYADNSHESAANGHPVPSHYEGLERNTQTTRVYEGLSQRPEYANTIGNDGFGGSSTLQTNNQQQIQSPYEELQRNQHQPMVDYQELIR